MAHWRKAECVRYYSLVSYRHFEKHIMLVDSHNNYWKDGNILTVDAIFTVNCVDRHAIKYPNRVALIWEKDKPGETEQVTYK